MKIDILNNEFILLVKGIEPNTGYFDFHREHIEDHMKILNDLDIKADPKAVRAILNHVEKHISKLVFANNLRKSND